MKCKIKYEQKTKVILLKEVLKNSLILGGVLLSLTYNSYASVTDITNKSLSTNLVEFNDGRTTDATKTKDEGSVVVGATNVFSNDNSDVNSKIVKYDKDGNQLWVKSFGGSGYDSFNSVIETQDEGFIAIGKSNSTNAGFVNKGDVDAIVAKYDKEGNQLWVKNFGGSGYDSFNSVIETQNEEIIVVGSSWSTDTGFVNKGEGDAVVVKYDKDGNQVLVKNFGRNGDDSFSSIIETQDGEFIAVGGSKATDMSTSTAIIVKYNNNMEEQWTKDFNESIMNSFNAVIETQDKGYIVTGTVISVDLELGSMNCDSAIIKYDKGGNQQWVKCFDKGVIDTAISIIEIINDDLVMLVQSIFMDSDFNITNLFSTIVRYNKNYEEIFDKIENVETTNNIDDLKNTRELVNSIPEGVFKEHFQSRLNNLNVSEVLERKTASSNVDIYIKSENVLMMSLDTNSITFEDFSGVEDMKKTNAVNITINSSLPYSLNAYLPAEIQNADKSNTMDLNILNIKENSEVDYQAFTNTTDKIILKDNNPAGNNLTHGIDIKLKGGISHEKDVYKTTIKFEAEQK